ncbi:MAG: hypothetical protein WCF97_04825, partial [Nitrososphaeraceae archaeon]
MTNETREKITDTAIDVMREMRYNNAGTVELLFKKGNFYFMEVNSRIQVEHAITEDGEPSLMIINSMTYV